MPPWTPSPYPYALCLRPATACVCHHGTLHCCQLLPQAKPHRYAMPEDCCPIHPPEQAKSRTWHAEGDEFAPVQVPRSWALVAASWGAGWDLHGLGLWSLYAILCLPASWPLAVEQRGSEMITHRGYMLCNLTERQLLCEVLLATSPAAETTHVNTPNRS